MAKRAGTVIPLNYGYHLEHAIAIVDTDWNRLVDLLQDPNRYFHRARNSWKIIGPPDVISLAWKVTEPATAILTPIHKSLFMVSQGLLAADVTGLNTFATIQERALWGTKTLISQPDFKKGFFVVQFAINTSVIHIGYFPPSSMKARYTRGYTAPTICAFGTTGLKCVSAHVDLEEPPAGASFRKLRADFLMDLIADYQGFLDKINSDDGFLLDLTMVDDATTPSGTPPDLTVPEVPTSMETVSKKYVLKAAATFEGIALPTVTVDQMGATELPGTPCVWPKGVTTTTVGDITTVESEDVVVKYYPEPVI